VNLLRPTVRLKLTLSYGGLFLLAGALLLTVNYALVRRSLGPAPDVGLTFVASAPAGAGPGTGAVRVFIGEQGGSVGAVTRAPLPGGILPEPVTPDGRKVSDVLQEVTNSYRSKTLHELVVKSLQALGLMAVLSVGFGWAISGRVLAPLHRMTATAKKLSEENLHERIALDGPDDELKELADTFDAMLARLEAAFESQKRFVANASHELRTPLSIIQANTSLALEHPWPEERYREFLAAIDTAAGRQSRIVEELLFLARADAGRLARDVGPVCLIEALEEAAEAASRQDRPCIRLESIDPALMVRGSGSELTRLFTNLLENAVRHTPPEGTVTVSAMVDAMSVTVTVTDTGEGIAPEHLPHLGERFYRVDAARSAGTGGNGLGLAICRSITEAHGGRMTLESQVGEGTEVRIRLLRCPLRT
jgi:heavy metal sensor kinase